MKNFKIKTNDLYDLINVNGNIMQEHTKDLEFKKIILFQKTNTELIEQIKPYIEKYTDLLKEKEGILKIANKKISEFKTKQFEIADKKDGKIDEEYKALISNFVQIITEETQKELNDDYLPKLEKLLKKEGAKEVEIELADDRAKVITENFEKYAKDIYVNKAKMVEIYEILVS